MPMNAICVTVCHSQATPCAMSEPHAICASRFDYPSAGTVHDHTPVARRPIAKDALKMLQEFALNLTFGLP